LNSIVLARVAAVTTAVALVVGGVCTGAASAAEPPTRADLQATITLDKSSYDSADIVHATLTIKNIGLTAAEGVKVVRTGAMSGFFPVLGDLERSAAGVRIGPRSEYVAELSAKVGMPVLANRLVFNGDVRMNTSDDTPADNKFEVAADVTFGTGSARVIVYGDANHNDGFDDGEGVNGVVVHLVGPNTAAGGRDYETATGPTGEARFTNIPNGVYRAYYTDYATGWLVPSQDDFTVELGREVEIVRKAARPLSDTLAAAVAFDQDVYAAGDTVGITVTLTNTGDALPVVYAECSGMGNSSELYNTTDGWGPLEHGASGVPLAAGETKVVQVTAPLPAGAASVGFVTVGCRFGPSRTMANGSPSAGDRAEVPGAVVDISARLLRDNGFSTPGTPIAGVEVHLRNRDTNELVASMVTDETGRFSFTGVPVGYYKPEIVGPWTLVTNRWMEFRLVVGNLYVPDVYVLPAT